MNAEEKHRKITLYGVAVKPLIMITHINSTGLQRAIKIYIIFDVRKIHWPQRR